MINSSVDDKKEPQRNTTKLRKNGEMDDENQHRRDDCAASIESPSYFAAIYSVAPLNHDASSKNLSTLPCSCKYYCLALGFVIAWFIQLVSMGAFFLYESRTTAADTSAGHTPERSVVSNLPNLDSRQSQIVVWSAYTSTLGVLTVILLSLLIQRMERIIMGRGTVLKSLSLQMECSITFGIVLGLISSCAVKEYMLGGNDGSWRSLMVQLLEIEGLALILYSLLIQRVQQTIDHGTTNESYWHQLQYAIAFGVAMGLIVACVVKNYYMLGVNGLWLSLMVFAVGVLYLALVYGIVSPYYFQGKEEEEEEESAISQQDSEEPLAGQYFKLNAESMVASDLSSMKLSLLHHDHFHTEQDMVISFTTNKNLAAESRSYRTTDLEFNLAVGCIIQSCGLGACLLHLSNVGKQNDIGSLNAIKLNLVRDLVTIGFGVLILVFVRRRLQAIKWSLPVATTASKEQEKDALTDDCTSTASFHSVFLLNIESVSVGAWVGLNLSLVATNYMMGFVTNMIHIVVMVVSLVVWYGTIASTTTEADHEMDEDDGDYYNAKV